MYKWIKCPKNPWGTLIVQTTDLKPTIPTNPYHILGKGDLKLCLKKAEM